MALGTAAPAGARDGVLHSHDRAQFFFSNLQGHFLGELSLDCKKTVEFG